MFSTQCQVFSAVGDPRDKFQEVPSSTLSPSQKHSAYSCLRTFRAGDLASPPKYLAWNTEPGIFFAEIDRSQMLREADFFVSVDFVAAARLIPHSADTGKILSLAMTEFHLVCCSADVVRGLSSLNDQLVFEDYIKWEVGL
jgi:hypothetical protein